MRAAKTMDYFVVLCMGLNIRGGISWERDLMNALGLSIEKDYKDIKLAFKCISNMRVLYWVLGRYYTTVNQNTKTKKQKAHIKAK